MLPRAIFLLPILFQWTVSQPKGEHKVHNIILNPEKYSRCQTTKIQQIVASPGYEPITIENNVCVGWCYSYSIPSTQPAEPGELIGPYCDSCQPVETTCYHVTLRRNGENADAPELFKKRVQIIKKCSCMSCDKVKSENCDLGETLELPQDLFTANGTYQEVREELPDFLDLPQKKSSVDTSKLNDLLKKLQNKNNEINYNQTQLDELLNLIENSGNGFSDSEESINLKDFFKKNEETPKIDLVAQNIKNNNQIEQDLKKFNLPPTFGLEGPHLKHHLGERVHAGMDLGRLVKGPHGSMVLAPDLKVEEKLNIDSDVLKPNHDGVVIEYENLRKRGLLIN